jgi:signal transduction histidine kinase
VSTVLEHVEQPVLVADASGQIYFANSSAKRFLESLGMRAGKNRNLFNEILHVAPEAALDPLRNGEAAVDLPVEGAGGKRARLCWLAEFGWVVLTLESAAVRPVTAEDPAIQQTLEELLQEREITYRNLLAAYLRLQEVNRQKTVFLASAAHELKTPLAVMKGYYDLLLSGSLGKLSEKQKEILQESKESCERLVRLISMFLNYSALESGKLVLHLRENDARECLAELAGIWQAAFARNQVRLVTQFSGELERFKFDYQKVQQTVANLLDNAMKHTPAGGQVQLSASPYFWERRAASVSPSVERRHGPGAAPNSILISVADSGPGIAPEYHQEVFEDFMRVDGSSSGMGLGLAISKRLVQAHRGKIWVDSEVGRGCTMRVLLPTNLE